LGPTEQRPEKDAKDKDFLNVKVHSILQIYKWQPQNEQIVA
jgi:hypothetical protein